MHKKIAIESKMVGMNVGKTETTVKKTFLCDNMLLVAFCDTTLCAFDLHTHQLLGEVKLLFNDRENGLRIKMGGVLHTPQNVATGWFLGDGETGYFTLDAAP